jgi:mannose-6-phosphate isomerase-like protein (cupin superfamily)
MPGAHGAYARWRLLFLKKGSVFSESNSAAGLKNMTDTINLAEKLATFDQHWSPRVIALFNGHDVMVVKVQGEFNWHSHPDTDDFFLVLKGEIDIELRDRTVNLKAGEMFIVPKGVEHRPVAKSEAHMLLIEPTGTPNTGDPETAAERKTI